MHPAPMSHSYPEVRDHVTKHLLQCGGGVTRQQLLNWGVPRWAMPRLCADGVLLRIERGYFVLPWSGEQQGWWARQRSEHLRAVAALAGGGATGGLRSAALASGLPVCSIPPLPELLRPPGSGYLNKARVIRRAVPPQHLAVINGVPVTSLARTAVDVALDLPPAQALVTIDAVLRRGVAPTALLSDLQSLGAVRGCRRARQSIEWADPHAESALESAGRGELMVRGTPRPWCNVSFRMDNVEFRADNWWPELGLVGEADGALKYSGDSGNALWSEKLRQEWFEDELGLTVFRFIDRQVRLAPDDLFARWQRKAAAASARSWTPPPELEVFQRPAPYDRARWTWLIRRDDLGAPS